jgi:hypothetical protein
VSLAVTWGLVLAWLIHDAEEWITMPAWSARASGGKRPGQSRFRDLLYSVLRASRLEASIAIGLVGVLVIAASWAGSGSGGRSAFFQFVLLAFGLHAIVHVAQSVLARDYTPGVVTAILVVAPFSWWAWQRLDRAGVVSAGGSTSLLLALVAFPVVVIGARLAGRGVARRVAPGGRITDDD